MLTSQWDDHPLLFCNLCATIVDYALGVAWISFQKLNKILNVNFVISVAQLLSWSTGHIIKVKISCCYARCLSLESFCVQKSLKPNSPILSITISRQRTGVMQLLLRVQLLVDCNALLTNTNWKTNTSLALLTNTNWKTNTS